MSAAVAILVRSLLGVSHCQFTMSSPSKMTHARSSHSKMTHGARTTARKQEYEAIIARATQIIEDTTLDAVKRASQMIKDFYIQQVDKIKYQRGPARRDRNRKAMTDAMARQAESDKAINHIASLVGAQGTDASDATPSETQQDVLDQEAPAVPTDDQNVQTVIILDVLSSVNVGDTCSNDVPEVPSFIIGSKPPGMTMSDWNEI